ncbi:MAG TPA: HD domain-containing phosphohydrolase [Acidimicrobiia bacterium]|nr:HD domain-containing phosphohydrolase [Acidimicrobiia bacterium]
MDRPGDPGTTRMAELLAALSLGIDLGFGQPMEHVLRQCRIALRVCELIGLSDDERVAVYYTALLVNVGCHTDAHEQAYWFGDDIAMKSTKYDHEPFSIGDVATMIRLLGSGATPLHRVRVAFDFAISGRKEVDGMIERHAALARSLAAELGLPESVLASVGSSYERWDGKGWPGDLAGDDIPLASRITQLAEFVEVAQRTGGIEAAQAIAERRAGKQFDPRLSAVLVADAEKVFNGIDDLGSWDAVIDGEPALTVVLSPEECDAALEAIARFVDLKSPYRLGHSQAVADLAANAGRLLALPPDEIRTLFRAGLATSFGTLGVSNAIWDKPGPLTAGEWERVRLAPHLTERMLHQSESLAAVGRLAVQHRERLDGSGYPRGLSGSAISRGGRILAAADAYQSMREPRPFRDAKSADDTARELRADVQAGRLDASAVDAVLSAAGHRVGRRREGPAGLTSREVEVLRLLARGLSNKQIAASLTITPKTASNHVEHIYTKIGASNRATASLFAMQHGLLPDDSAD